MTLKLIAAATFAAFLAVTPIAPAETTPTDTATSPAVTDRQIGATTVFETTTVEQVTTVDQVTTVFEPAPAATTSATTTSGLRPGAAAAAGAAAATQNQSSSDSTDWGWIAFGILAAAVIGGCTVWLVRRRRPAPGS